MKRRYVAQSISTTPRYLTIQVRVEVGTTVRWIDVKVPWRLLNEQYEDVANEMAREASEHLKAAWDVPMLPLEKWE